MQTRDKAPVQTTQTADEPTVKRLTLMRSTVKRLTVRTHVKTGDRCLGISFLCKGYI